MTLKDLRGVFSGTRCAILGNGPSLPEDLEALMKIDVLPVLVGVNRSWKLHETMLHVALDEVHVVEMRERWWRTGLLFLKPEFEMALRSHTHSLIALDGPPDGWPLSRHIPLAGPAAIQVALWMGLDPILLCGFDMHEGDGRKFYEAKEVGATSFLKQKKYVRRLVAWATKCGTTLRCINDESALVVEGIVPHWRRCDDGRNESVL